MNPRDFFDKRIWISVKDRLPEKSDNYLCIVKNTGVRIRCFAPWVKHSRLRWWCNGRETEKVTHWTPLPEPPNAN